LAGECTQRITELEKAISAKQEGAGPALAAPTTTGSTAGTSKPGSDPQSAVGTVPPQGLNEAMNLLHQAKQLDQQGREAECLQMTTRVGALAPPATR
jgi:hypothetical protein